MSFLNDAKNQAEATKKKRIEAISQEKREKFQRITEQCLSISKTLREDVLKEAGGKSASHTEQSLGHVKYRIKDKYNSADYFFEKEKGEIETTEGFKKLHILCQELGLKICIEKSLSDIKDDPDFPAAPSLYFFDITISGWA